MDTNSSFFNDQNDTSLEKWPNMWAGATTFHLLSEATIK